MASNDIIVDEYKYILSYFGYKSYMNDITWPLSRSWLEHIHLKSNETTMGKNQCVYTARTNETDH